MYKIKKSANNDDNCAIINTWLIKWDMRQSDLTENSLNGKVFTGHL